MPGSIAPSEPYSCFTEHQETLTSISRTASNVSVNIHIAELKTDKLLRHVTSDTLWTVKTHLLQRMPDLVSQFPDCWNWGFLYDRGGTALYTEGSLLRNNRAIENGFFSPYKLKSFLDDSKTFEQLRLQGQISLTFVPRFRITQLDEKTHKKINSAMARKKFLQYLACHNDGKLADMLQKGFDPNFITEDGLTPLIIALNKEDKIAITLLLHFDAYADYRTPDHKAPMHWAALHDKAFSISSLVTWGANPNIFDTQRSTPLHYACSKGHADCVEPLLQGFANPHLHDDAGRSPLHLAAGGHPECISLLLDVGANIHDVNSLGNTPLHVAASMNEEACALLLLSKGANKHALNLAGKTAEQMAISGNFYKLAEKIRLFVSESRPPSMMDLVMNEYPGSKYCTSRPLSRASSVISETSTQAVRKRSPAPPPPIAPCGSPVTQLETDFPFDPTISPWKLALKKFHSPKSFGSNLFDLPHGLENNYVHPQKLQDPFHSPGKGMFQVTTRTNELPLPPLLPPPPPPEFDFSTLSLHTDACEISSSTPPPPPPPPLPPSPPLLSFPPFSDPLHELLPTMETRSIEIMSTLTVDQLQLFQLLVEKNAFLEQSLKKLSRELDQVKRKSIPLRNK